MIAARHTADEHLADLNEKLNQGVKYYHEHTDESIEYITTAMHYSKEDAQAWQKTVQFASDVRGVKVSVVDNTVSILQKAGVLTEAAGGSDHMVTKKIQ